MNNLILQRKPRESQVFYKCLDCGCTFDDPDFIEDENFMGNRAGQNVCPRCGSDDIEQGAECDLCGGWTDGSRFCTDCRSEVMERFNEFLYVHFSQDEIDLINEETDGEPLGN